jgi:nicotine blue oxidoreductase
MGSLKALLPWKGTTVAAYVVKQLLETTVARIIVVTGNGAKEVGEAIAPAPRVTFVLNDRWEEGKAGSIVRGVEAIPKGWHILIAAIDQPRPASLLQGAIEAHLGGLADGRLATVAGFSGRRGHPIIVVPELRDELLAIDEATAGLRAVVRRHDASMHVVDLGDPAALINLNTPEEYALGLASEAAKPML